ncbi:MAG: hypothetical protein GEV03_14115 [Streptosporangiales bacterium]|nr:hypothetical protein [Streptosporangiales bacterium]
MAVVSVSRAAATPADLAAARLQMGLSLGRHIIVACFGGDARVHRVRELRGYVPATPATGSLVAAPD